MAEKVAQQGGGPSQRLSESSASVASQEHDVVLQAQVVQDRPEMTSDKKTARCADEMTMTESTEAEEELFRTIVKETPEATKCYHKELLFGLFLNSDDAELSALADKAKAPRLSDCVAQPKRRRDEGGKSTGGETKQSQSSIAADGNGQRPGKRARSSISLTWDAEFGKPSTLSLLPRALLTAPSVDDPQVSASISAIRPASGWSYDSKLENMVAERFRTSSIGKKVLSTKEHRVASASLKGDESSGEKAAFVPFSLVYNECSMSTLAAWALRKNDSPGGTEAKALSSSDTIYRPVPTAIFRRCSGCHEWGHYEVECKSLGTDEIIQLSRETKVQMAKLKCFNESKEEQSPKPARVRFLNKQRKKSAPKEALLDLSSTLGIPCDVCNTMLKNELAYVCCGCSRAFHTRCMDESESPNVPHSAWLCERCADYRAGVSSSTELEGCEGFVIEQRKRHRNSAENKDVEWGFPRDGWSSAVGLNHGLQSEDNTNINPFGGMFECESLIPGDLCWTRRNSEDFRWISEKDNWWPSVVLSLQATDSLSTTYRVKRFALREVNCKASVALPFLQHFERFGYNRIRGMLAHRWSEDSRSFEKALNMALGECGLTCVSALQRSREICGMEDSESEMQGWSDAEETNQDRFLIRAARDPLDDFIIGNERPTALLSGSVVAWCPDLPNTTVDNGTSGVLQVGVVLAANLGDELALVRPIEDWKDVLSQVSRMDSFVVRSCAVGSSTWFRMADLHIISSGAPARIARKFSKTLLPNALRDQRERLKRSYQEARKSEAAQQLRVLGSPDDDFSSVEFLTSTREIDPAVDEFASAQAEKLNYAQARGQSRILENSGIPSNAERCSSDEAMVSEEFIEIDTSNCEDVDNNAEAAIDIDVSEMTSNEQQSCEGTDEVSTKNVSIREETTRVESKIEHAQTVVDSTDDTETAMAVMTRLGTKPPSGNAEIAVEDRNLVPSETALEIGKEDYAASLAVSTLEERRHLAAPISFAANALDTKPSSPDLTSVTACERRAFATITDSTTVTTRSAKVSEWTAAKTLDVKLPSPGSTTNALSFNAEVPHTKLTATLATNPKSSDAAVTTRSAKVSEWTAAKTLDVKLPNPGSTTNAMSFNAEVPHTKLSATLPTNPKSCNAESTTATILETKTSTTALIASIALDTKESSAESSTATALIAKTSNTEPTCEAEAMVFSFDAELTVAVASKANSSTAESTTATTLNAKASSAESAASIALDAEASGHESTTATALNAKVSSTEPTVAVEAIFFSADTDLTVAVASMAKASIADSPTVTTLVAKASSAESTASIALDAMASSAESTTATALSAKASSTEPTVAAEAKVFSTESTAAVAPKARTSSSDLNASTALNGKASSVESTAAATAPDAKASSSESTTTTLLSAKTSSTEPASASALGAQALDYAEFVNGTEGDTFAADTKMKGLAENGIYEVEAILDDRQVVVGNRRARMTTTEYLIKWVGYPMEDCTWEPKKNILDQSMVQKYEVDKIYNKLVTTPSVSMPDTPSSRVLRALQVGRQRLDKLLSEAKIDTRPPASIRKLCPFCRTSFGQVQSLRAHLKVHRSAFNFDLLKEAALVAEEAWYS